jgi:hypothetical protein
MQLKEQRWCAGGFRHCFKRSMQKEVEQEKGRRKELRRSMNDLLQRQSHSITYQQAALALYYLSPTFYFPRSISRCADSFGSLDERLETVTLLDDSSFTCSAGCISSLDRLFHDPDLLNVFFKGSTKRFQISKR